MTNSHHLVWPTNSHTKTLDHGAPSDIVTFVACQFKGFSSLYRQSEVQEQTKKKNTEFHRRADTERKVCQKVIELTLGLHFSLWLLTGIAY